MNDQSEITFSSKYCKSYSHPKCFGRWAGLGFTVICDCSCHEEERKGIGYKIEPTFTKKSSNISYENDIKRKGKKSKIHEILTLKDSGKKENSEKKSLDDLFSPVSLKTCQHNIQSRIDSKYA